MSITVLKPGAFSSFQDLGRAGMQHAGVPVSGVMDELSHRLANWAAGNRDDTATLEITLLGPELRFEQDAIIAWCGADLSPTFDGHRLPAVTPTRVSAGSTLRFGRRIAGLRAYLAINGGYAIDPVMGSRSTYVRGGFGGLQGRALRKDDPIPLPARAAGDAPREIVARPVEAAVSRALAALLAAQGTVETERPVRIVAGREWSQFGAPMRRRLLETPWRIGAQSDRMGYRLEGEPLRRASGGDILSEAVSFGTIQVPPDGQPIVLMAERQTTGGYPKIGQVASVDLPLVAQRGPGEHLRFELIELEQAQQLLLERARLWRTVWPVHPALQWQ
ncbi:MAG TPA: biotin-dependent carboxyltransferase family protein [Burkholderiaceae bacterium]|nr:biotin-dependent carboxyltransferase family protein [Burkholderiaceae bacterium]